MSPNCISNIECNNIDEDFTISSEDILLMAKIGFNYLKEEKKYKIVTLGNSILEFVKNDNPEYHTPLFGLTITLICNMKDKLNEIDSTLYSKLFRKIVSEYANNF